MQFTALGLASPLCNTQRIWCGLYRRSFLQGIKCPHTSSDLISVEKTAAKIKQVLDFPESFRLKTRCYDFPFGFLCPRQGLMEYGRGWTSITAALVPWSHNWNLQCLFPAFVKWSCSRWQLAWQIIWTHLEGHMSQSELHFQSSLYRSEPGPQESAAREEQTIFSSVTFLLMMIDQTHWSLDFIF